jgi:hypothetical protein
LALALEPSHRNVHTRDQRRVRDTSLKVKHGGSKRSHIGLKTVQALGANLSSNYQFPQNKFLRKRLSINDKCATRPHYSLIPPRLGTNIGNKKSQREFTEE